MADSEGYIKRLEEENLKLQQDNAEVQKLRKQKQILQECFTIALIFSKEAAFNNNSIGFQEHVEAYKTVFEQNYQFDSNLEQTIRERTDQFGVINAFFKRLDNV